MDQQSAYRIVEFLDEKVAALIDPRTPGKNLKGDLGEFWRYRVSDYRVICEIQDEQLTILAVTIGRRREVYKA